MDKHTEFKIIVDGEIAMYANVQEVAIEIANGFLSERDVKEVKVIRSEVIWATTKNTGGN